jgi:3-deoxy-D-manno-octulosonate 8-phosphate phosphatase (KDO 8-P phosphatase)
MPDSKSRAKKIKLLLFDVDGVLTDGKLFFVPSAAQENRGQAAEISLTSQGSIEIKGFHAHDGVAVSLARVAGIKTGLITKRASETVAVRARDLKLDHIYQGIQDKLGAFREILKKEGLKPSEACFVGDDVIDLPVMWNCGLAVAVANARDEVKKDAHYVTKHAGGDGALRDAVEFILKSQGRLKKVVEKYVGAGSKKKESQ